MRSIRGPIRILCLSFAVLAGTAFADATSLPLQFDIADDGAWEGGGLAELRRERHPIVPVRVVRFLLSKSETFTSAELEDLDVRETRRVPQISAQQLPMDPTVQVDRLVEPWDGRPYPSAWLGKAEIRQFRGHRIVEIPVYPFRYLGPDAGALFLEAATLVVRTQEGNKALTKSRDLNRDLTELYSRVDNPPDDADKVRIVRPDEETGYLIIGPRALIGTATSTALAPLIASKEDRHLVVTLAALEDVSPTKDPKKIRDFIRTKHQSAGVDFVLLVGDKGNLPWKYVRSGMNGDGDPVPSDQYYACLDGEFDRPEAIDWSCEVAVGRVGAKTEADVAAWVAKTVSLQNLVYAGKTQHALSYGEKLDNRTLGERVLNFLIDGHSAAPRTSGFPATTRFTKLYDDFRKEIPGTDFISSLNDGDFHVVNHLGHANETYVFRTNASQLSSFRSRPAFYYSQGCYPNDPDHDNWTIRAVRMPSFGPAAMISNTRFGWYEPGSSGEGSSSVLHRSFWSQRFAGGVKSIGAMNHRAKEVMIAADASDVMIYTALESNLIGDPELDLGM